ncbi:MULTISPECIES: aminotransferase class V-fold PLP-dependent enzyme [unclassified Pseudomonas]|uniref:aminotransferase class V-fold PLP-dependent enzyme n=1 Tax=unclassified Pseudomonas TaxID=196821 RepID=UPI000BC46F6A|nr:MULTISPECIES: aminotransferase class V-fold PLP-dependent enzyme [unclassified Pseudomonas]PVZ16170.1 selenocysteine lyase/cysteine desulfurase [Pseudomonas sp. URIL14HWK12:I12]PVZ25974.1 selenocysteine lyase/cysteine desulfurase [Pseudomonas sp. URIL14HWK12:I10]PVZ36502.1 selenocysteine lyase/cysteine desulfurase [Pseudomonas sp. URIL14HWK12:I11]SNZ18564.1 Selenocysteine lyase/Cysteine desulfurase [Pseudomonas sp. URIL14HWK12:I9]
MSTFLEEFPQAEGLLYLNHAAVAPWPRRSAEAISRFAQQNVALGARDYPQWVSVEDRLRARFQRLLNAPSVDDIALVKNTSEALSFVAQGLNWAAGDQVVISDEEFPSNRIVWEALQPLGVEVVKVSLTVEDPEAALLAACGPRTRLLAVSCVQYASGLKLDMARLGAGLKAQGILFCIDAIQQLGAQPFDVQAYDCDFAMADGHKWLLGPEGLGVFYCRERVRPTLALREFGWHMVERMGDYSRTDWEPARSARRFECGSPNMLGTMGLEASLGLLEEVGMPEVARLIEARIQQLSEGLSAIPGVQQHQPADPARRAGILTFSAAGKDHQALWRQLMDAGVVCIPRGKGIRLSPHFYTSPAIIDQALGIIDKLARQ